jgi:ArsR family transcriptional regulator
MTEQDLRRYEARASIFKALAHPTRLYILEQLREEEQCVSELTELVGADASTVSKHLSILKSAGLVQSRKHGTTVYYDLACGCLNQFMDGAETLLRMKAENDAAVLQE